MKNGYNIEKTENNGYTIDTSENNGYVVEEFEENIIIKFDDEETDNELDRFDEKYLSTLKENGTMNMSELIMKANTRENRKLSIKRVRALKEMGLVDFDESNVKNSGYKISLRSKV